VGTAAQSRRHGGPIVLRCRSGLLRPALRPPLGESPVCGSTGFGGVSNRRLSKGTWQTQIVDGRVETGREISGGEPSCGEARDWAAFQVTDRMEGVSQDPLLLLRRITPASRVAALRAAGHRRRVRTASGKGGGNAFAALRSALGAS
jgi:hypothetical protein